MTSIVCSKCLQEKPFGAFYKSNQSRCKDCVKASVNAHRQANLEQIRAYDRMRGSMPHRVAARAEYAKTDEGKAAHLRANEGYRKTENGKSVLKAYLQTPGGKMSRERTVAASNQKHPERHRVRIKFGNAVRDGKVLAWPTCALPDCSDKPHGHHPDYDRPLDVVWLCPLHHKQAHALVESNTSEI